MLGLTSGKELHEGSLILAHVPSTVNPSQVESRICYFHPLNLLNNRQDGPGTLYPKSTLLALSTPATLDQDLLLLLTAMGPNNEQWKSREVARLLALVETERRYYQEMVDYLPICVGVVNQLGNLVAANRAFRQTYDVRSDELRKRALAQIFPSVELQARVQSVFESGIGSRPLIIDRQNRRLRITIQTLRDWDEDAGLQALVAVEDLADELNGIPAAPAAPAAPAPTEIPLAVVPPPLPASLPCVLWTARASDRSFTLVSPSIKTLLDFDPDEWLLQNNAFATRIDHADRHRTLQFYVTALASAGLHSCEFRMRRPGVWYRETILVTDDSLTGVITDITARRGIEEQILQAQRFDALTHLAGRLAHDVNNPLMIVNGYAEDLATAFPSTDPRAADLREIQLAGKRIGEITAQLHAVTRKQLNVMAAVDANAELAKVVERMRIAAGDYLQADHVHSAQPLSVMADAGQLEAILLELSAALVEGGGESAHLILSANPYQISEVLRPDQPLGTGNLVEISILNQSHSAPHLLPRMFESLLPGKESGRESGPALAKAFKTVQDWGGFILPLQEKNQICVYLKAAAAPATQPPEQLEPGPVGPAPTPGASGKTVEFVRKTNILVVEDEPGIRALIRKIMQREGFEVFEAGNGVEALEVFKQKGPFNLLITDVRMPNMTGLELATRVQATDPYCGILYMSGFTADTGVETGQFPPGSHFLQKPFTLGSLLRKANEVLASTPRRPAE